MKPITLVLTCEHAGNRIPASFAYLFQRAGHDLSSHLGWDPGALRITKQLAGFFEVDYHAYDYSRLLIEVNRSVGHPQLFSGYTRDLSQSVKKYLIKTYYEPYREKVTRKMAASVEAKRLVVHLSVHTFTPVWEGKQRAVEIGLLFDDKRKAEKKFCETWCSSLAEAGPPYTVRYNEPYHGADDGLTTYLRTLFPEKYYLGLELEVNQKFVNSGLDQVITILQQSLNMTLENENSRK